MICMSTDKDVKKEILVSGGYARAFEVKAGELFTVTDMDGGQIADLVAFNARDLSEKLSPSHTRLALHSIRFKVGDSLRTNLRRPMMEIVEDTVGTHDMLIPA